MSGWLNPRPQSRNWDHGRLLGKLAFIKDTMRCIMQSGTTTDEAKALAAKIDADLHALNEAMRTRADLQESRK